MTIIILLILAGVSLNAIIGDNGVITNAQKAKIESEEAELWEKVQMVLVEGMGQDLDREKYVEEVNKKFESQGLKAKIGLRADGYAVTYGKYSRKVALLSDDLQILGEIVAIEGSSEVWDFEIKDDGTLRLTGYSKDKKGEIQIPNIIDGKFVTEIGKIFWTSNITSVNIPEGIEIIDESAFFECSELNCKIIFPSSLKEIGDKAFYGCLGIEGDLNSIVEQGIKTGKNAFAKCSKMKGDIDVLINTLDETVTQIEENQFSGFSGVTGTLTIPKRIKSIGANAFSKCSGLTAIEFENESELTEIGNYAFSQCSSVNNRLDLPDSVTTIGEYAFNECSNLAGVDLSTELTSIGQYAFYNCSKLGGNLIFPIGLDNSGNDAFRSTGNLSVGFLEGREDNNVFTFSSESFWQSGISNLGLPSSKVIVGYGAFYSCSALANIDNSENIAGTGNIAFQGCSFKAIDLSGAKYLSDSSFSNCKNLTTLPNIVNSSDLNGKSGVTSIGGYCFSGCSGLQGDVVEYLTSSVVTSVGDSAFSGCSNLTGDFNGSINNIKLGVNIFLGTKVSKVTNVSIDDSGYLIVHGDKIGDGVFKDTTKFVKNSGDEEKEYITDIKIPDNIKSIGKDAFSGCSSITSIKVPNSVTSIGNNAFSGCVSLISIVLPENGFFNKIPDRCFSGDKLLSEINLTSSIVEIGSNAFSNCKLKEVNLSNIRIMGIGAFSGCSSLAGISGWSSSLTEIPYACFESCGFVNLTIPDSVTDIGNYAFRNCLELENVTVGKGVSKVPVGFMDNASSLKEIKFNGEIISIGGSAFSGQKNLKEITISWDKLRSIGVDAFKNCSSLTGDIELNFDCSYDEETTFSGSGLKVRRQTN